MPKVLGHVDGLEGRFLSGWAYCEEEPDTCLIRVFNNLGSELGRGRASHHRADLSSIAHGRSDFAFRIALEIPTETERLHIWANDQELHGSPIEMGPGRFDGAVHVHNGLVEGWVTERRVTTMPLHIQITDQYDRIVADGFSRTDAANAGMTLVRAPINLELDAACFGIGELSLKVSANGVVFARTTCNARLLGYLDSLTPRQCRGWLFSPDATLLHHKIEVFIDGRLAGSGLCDIPREDLKEPYPQSWKCGFDISIKDVDDFDEAHSEVRFRLAGSPTELFGGPFVTGHRSNFIEAARRVATLVFSDSNLGVFERSVLQSAMMDFITSRRSGADSLRSPRVGQPAANGPDRRLSIIIPIYKGVALTRACIKSVVATCDEKRDNIILINDCSPDPEMASMLDEFSGRPNIHLIHNATNLGFIMSVNRALDLCDRGDVLLLNSDTRLFPGGVAELHAIAKSDGTIGTVTALSNNATIFSYPHPRLIHATLDDISWQDLARGALEAGAGKCVDVPTGHGFCMLIKREVMDRIGHLDERFGRGYGEENDFCMRAADLGYRNVAAVGVLVEHRESISFGEDKKALLRVNMPKLNSLYPEYTATIMAFERQDGLRAARWPLDIVRLKQVSRSGTRFVLVVQNGLEGGTNRAIRDIEEAVGYEKSEKMSLTGRQDGMMELTLEYPSIHAVFAESEVTDLFSMLSAAQIDLVLIHQLLGFSETFIQGFPRWAEGRHVLYYVHDFCPICPRVTLIDAVGRFCGAATAETCKRCIELGGAHEYSRLNAVTAVRHRILFENVLNTAASIVTPSDDTAKWLNRIYPGVPITPVAHPQVGMTFPKQVRNGKATNIVLLGALGHHKGSAKLLEIARLAQIVRPDLRFHVIGYTNIDDELRKVGNVSISGGYKRGDLASLIDNADARTALFLHGWPETFSYTLTEAVSMGLIPLVPDIGAPAERVRKSGFGIIFPFPIDAENVFKAIDASSHNPAHGRSMRPDSFDAGDAAIRATAALLRPEPAAKKPVIHDIRPAIHDLKQVQPIHARAQLASK
jgi:GT2 family glycosyltransferase/glycosyltransferase involved in cell wall biosynthesis